MITLTKIKEVKISIPKQLLIINPLPKIPNCVMQSDVANYIIDLWQQANNYKDNLEAIKKIQGQ